MSPLFWSGFRLLALRAVGISSICCGAAALALLMGGTPVAATPCWRPPVVAKIADPFREPACPWCPGNRGIEYATRPGLSVSAVATGEVTFAGSVAGGVYLVVAMPGGRRVTYGNLVAAPFDIGDVIVAGTALGVTAGHLHLGVRVGDRYVDPAPFLGRWAYRPRLIPVDGSPAPPSPEPRLRCAAPTIRFTIRTVSGSEPAVRWG